MENDSAASAIPNLMPRPLVRSARTNQAMAAMTGGVLNTNSPPKPDSDAADAAELNRTLADVNNPASRNSPLGGLGATQRATQAPTTPALQRPAPTALPTMTVNGPEATPAPASDVGSRVALGRTFGTRAPDGSIAFSNIPGQVGYDQGFNRAGENIQVAPAAAPNATAGIAALPGAPMIGPLTRAAHVGADASGVPSTKRADGQNVTLPDSTGAASNAGVGTAFNMTRPAPSAGDQQTGLRYDSGQDELQVRSDINSILNEDPRSSLGVAARNARINLGDLKAPRGSGSGTPYQQAILSLLGNTEGAVKSARERSLEGDKLAGEFETTSLRDSGDTAREGMRLAGELYRPSYHTDDKGNLIGVSGYGSNSVVGPDGTPVKVPLTKEDASDKREAITMAELAKTAATQLGNFVPPGKQASNEQIAQARLSAAKIHGLRTASAQGKAPLVEIAPGQWVPL